MLATEGNIWKDVLNHFFKVVGHFKKLRALHFRGGKGKGGGIKIDDLK